MRLDKLTLKRFGSFTDKTIDFGKANSELDLHLIYGPNEAGKSTLRSAVECFLYGIPARTPYNFLHDSKLLQIEAGISSGDQQHELIRIKRGANSLLSKDNQPVGDDFLRPLLRGVDLEAYVSMFSMDEDSLELGGNSILESKGDLGELLFASTSGIAALGSSLAKVRAETENFYKLRGKQIVLRQKSAELKALKEQVKALDVSASTFAVRKKAQKEAAIAHEAAVVERAQHELETKRLKALLDCAELWRDYEVCEEKAGAMADLPPLPESWLARGQTLAQQLVGTETRIEQLQHNIEAERANIDSLEPQPAILSRGAQIDRLSAGDIEAKFRAADSAEAVTAALDSINEQLQRNLAALRPPEGTEPQNLLLPAARIGQIRALMNQRASIDALLQAATNEHARADEALRAVSATQHALGQTADLADVERQGRSLRENGFDKELDRLKHELRAQRAILDPALAQLEPWRGDAAALKALVVPTASEIERRLEQQREHDEQARRLASEQQRVQGEVNRLEATLSALRARGDLVDDAAAAEARKRRNERWREHRQALDAHNNAGDQPKTTADRFEALMAEDDALQATRFAQANELGELRAAELQHAQAAAELAQTHAHRSSLESLQTEFTQSLQQLCAGIDLPPQFPLTELQRWLTRRAEALLEAQKYARISTDIERVEAQVTQGVTELKIALNAAGSDAGARDFRQTLQLADEAVAQWREQNQTAKETQAALRALTQELELRSKQLAAVNQQHSEWQIQWQDALSGLWLVADGRVPPVAEVSEVLRSLDGLSGLLDKRGDAVASLGAMQTNREAYLAEVADIAKALSVPMNLDNPLETADELRERLAAARDIDRRRSEAGTNLENLQARLNAERAEHAESERHFAEMTAVFPAATAAELVTQLQNAQTLMQLKDRLGSLKRQITHLLGVADFDEAKVQLAERLPDQAAIDALSVEHSNAQARAADLSSDLSRLYHQWQAAKEALEAISADEDVAVLNEKIQLLLEDIKAETKRFIALSAGSNVVERALHTYLDSHRSTMLTRASAAFATITRGAFKGLDAMPGIVGKSNEELVGIRSDGSSTAAREMSRGSRFQLYLSLRIAGYHEFVAAREPLPFFADDILETFDDDRSAETFGLMAEMAQHGQVIYLTHHAHLCDIAKRVTGNRVKIHELPARSLVAPAGDAVDG